MDLNQLTLPCSDLAVSKAFYSQLGFRLIVDSPPRYARFECDAGSTFSLHRVPVLAADTGVVAYFEVEELDATVARLQAAGIRFDTEPVDQPWLWREASLKDPAGNALRLYTAGNNRRYPPWRLGGGGCESA